MMNVPVDSAPGEKMSIADQYTSIMRVKRAREDADLMRNHIAKEIQLKQSGSMLAKDYLMVVAVMEKSIFDIIVRERGIEL